MASGGARIQGVELAVHDAVEGHGAGAGADHGGQDQAERAPAGPAVVLAGGHRHRSQSERQGEDRVGEPHEGKPFVKQGEHSFLHSFSLPHRGDELVRDAEVVQHAGHHGVHDLLHGLRAGVEGGIGRQDRRAGQQQQFEVLDVDQVQRRFAGHQDELLLLLQHHIGGAQQDVLAVAVGDAAQRAHGAGNHDHRVGRVRAAGERRVHALQVVRCHARWKPQAAGQFLGDHCWRVVAEHHVDLVLGGIQVVEQTLGVKRAAGSGDGDEYFQG